MKITDTFNSINSASATTAITTTSAKRESHPASTQHELDPLVQFPLVRVHTHTHETPGFVCSAYEPGCMNVRASVLGARGHDGVPEFEQAFITIQIKRKTRSPAREIRTEG